ncbi:MAG TPA: GNAT family N-acetyltransferase [Novosphingobium sp.]|nr:GNAT family N-acetyltransferase [Novosphingobium sp.]
MSDTTPSAAPVALSAQAPCSAPHIRPAQAADADALAALKLATFHQTFGAEGFAIPYPPADLAVFVAQTYSPEQAAAEIADPAHRTWVAHDEDGALLAYAHVGPCKLPVEGVAPGDGELYQLYLLRSVQGTGLARRLFDTAMGWLEARGGQIWIGVWSGNIRAQRFYAGCGFEPVATYQFPVGEWRDDEIVMRRLAQG